MLCCVHFEILYCQNFSPGLKLGHLAWWRCQWGQWWFLRTSVMTKVKTFHFLFTDLFSGGETLGVSGGGFKCSPSHTLILFKYSSENIVMVTLIFLVLDIGHSSLEILCCNHFGLLSSSHYIRLLYLLMVNLSLSV